MRQDIALLLLFSPVGACIWWLMSRGWAKAVQGGTVSEKTVKRQRVEFWGLLVAAYIVEAIGALMKHKW
jgi:hypothetical protein